MKKIALFLPLFFLFSVLHAQIEMRWDSHGVGFVVPSDFKVIKSTGEEYTAQNESLYLTINPIQDENIDKSHLAEAVLAFAKELKYDSIEETDEIKIDDFEGYYLKGTKDGANALIMTLLDPESSTNLLVVIIYDESYFDEAMAVGASFFAYDK